MRSIDNFLHEFDEYIAENFVEVRADEVGLDNRCGRIYIDPIRSIVASCGSDAGRLEYYGGFEYIDRDSVVTIGAWKIYPGWADERVMAVVDASFELEEE